MCLGGILPQLPLNLSVCNNARDHHRALREISKSPQRHRTGTPWHTSHGRIGMLNRSEAMPRTAMQRGGVLEAERQAPPFRRAQQLTTNAAPSATALSL